MDRICLFLFCASLCHAFPQRRRPEDPLSPFLGPGIPEPLVIRSFDGRDVFKSNDTVCNPEVPPACEQFGATSTDSGNCRCTCNEDTPVYLESERTCSEALGLCNIVLPYNLSSETQRTLRVAPVVEPPGYNKPIYNTRFIDWQSQGIDPVRDRCRVKSASCLGRDGWKWDRRGTFLFTFGIEDNETVLYFTGDRHPPDIAFVTGKLFKIEVECSNHEINGSLCILLRMIGGNKDEPFFGHGFGGHRGPRIDGRGPPRSREDDEGPRFEGKGRRPPPPPRFGGDPDPREVRERGGPRFGWGKGDPQHEDPRVTPMFAWPFGEPNASLPWRFRESPFYNDGSTEDTRPAPPLAPHREHGSTGDRHPPPPPPLSHHQNGPAADRRPFPSSVLHERRADDIRQWGSGPDPTVPGSPFMPNLGLDLGSSSGTSVQDSSMNIVLTTVLSALAIILILIMAGFWYFKRNTRNRQFKNVLKENISVKTDNWEISRVQLEICYEKKLGSGTFGAVYKGNLHSDPKKASTKASEAQIQSRDSSVFVKSREVAVKMLPEYADAGAKSDFIQEINLMKSLGQHSHVVSILGCITIDEPLCLIVEYCSDGDLLQFLRSKRSYMESQKNSIPDFTKMLSMKELLSFGWQACDGMEYIADKQFVHRDVAARNVMVDHGKTVKIGDFGLTRFILGSSSYFSRGGRFPLKWMAPESIRYNEFTTRSDVWSFGILLFEIVTLGNAPYAGMHPADMEAYLYSGKLMDKPEECPDNLFQLMKTCWTLKPEERPTFTWIKEELRQMLETATEDYSYLKLDDAGHYRHCFNLSHSSSFSSGSDVTVLRISVDDEDEIPYFT